MSKKYKVIKTTEYDKLTIGLKVGDVVTFIEQDKDFSTLVLVRLPKRLHGKGHNGLRYKKNNYKYLLKNQIEPIKENISE